MEENIMKISFHMLGQFWQQEEDQLTSASVPYQMVGLFDYKNVLISNLHYIWVSFLAKLLLSNRYGTPCSVLCHGKLFGVQGLFCFQDFRAVLCSKWRAEGLASGLKTQSTPRGTVVCESAYLELSCVALSHYRVSHYLPGNHRPGHRLAASWGPPWW